MGFPNSRRVPQWLRRWSFVLTIGFVSFASSSCKDNKTSKNNPAKSNKQAPERLSYPSCQAAKTHTGLPPQVRPEMLKAKFWLDRLGPERASAPLLTFKQIEALNQETRALELGVRELPEPLTPDAKKKQGSEFHQEQQAYVHQKLGDKSYMESIPGSTKKADGIVSKLVPRDDYFALVKNTQLRCWPIEGGVFKPPMDKDFDRNNCSTLQPPTLVHRIVSTQADNWHYIQSEFVEGWIQNPSWQPVKTNRVRRLMRGPKRWVSKDQTTLKGKGGYSAQVSMGSVLPVDRKGRLSWPTEKGWQTLAVRKQAGIERAPLTLTRKDVFELAFAQLDRPYGWGGRSSERDCSRLLLDVLRVFGIQLPRWSGHQAKVPNSVDISMLSIKDKRATLRRFGESNLLLLFMPGHIMLYLGPDAERDYALSSISEFVTPCTQDDNTLGEQVHRLDRVTVTDLSLGQDSPRRSFIERITHMVRF